MIINYNTFFLILFFIFEILFVVFMNIQAFYRIKLKLLLKRKYPNLYHNLVLVDLPTSFFPNPIKMSKFIWSKKEYKSDIQKFVNKIRFFLKIGLISLSLPFIILIIFAILGIL